jgi:hypothetical protein
LKKFLTTDYTDDTDGIWGEGVLECWSNGAMK